MILPKIEHDLMNTNLTQQEKIAYIKARCVVSAALHSPGEVCNDDQLNALDTLYELNNKINNH